MGTLFRDLVECNFQLIDGIRACLIHARMLARRSDKHPGEQVGERRMVLPITNQASQQIGAAQECAVRRGGAADHNVIASSGARVLPIHHEFLSSQASLSRQCVDGLGRPHQFFPRRRGQRMFTSMTPGSGVTFST